MKLNYSFMMEDFLGKRGVSPEDLNKLRPTIEDSHKKIIKREFQELQFLDLPFQNTSEIEKTGQWVRERAENFIILGIGGSALGPRVIRDCLHVSPVPAVYIYDNVDPLTLHKILEQIDLKKTVFNVISKSGTTGETIASFMIIWEILKKSGLKPEEHFIITTDPEKGPLRRIAREHNLKSLPIPAGVVGRYSVLSSVGLLCASVINILPQELLQGAREIHEKCDEPDIFKNPAYLFGALLYINDINFSRRINIFMPYADSLKSLSEWFCQLWAESLGKDGRGLMPYPSTGATDQHSQLQLWIEGPDDKVVIFIKIEDYGRDVKIPPIFEDIKEFSFLGGHYLSELIKTEQESTALSLMKAGRPNMTITVPAINAHSLGSLFHFLEIATAFTGILYGINPFNQPAVESGKIYTKAMMGQEGLETWRREVLENRKKAIYEIK
ncbi:MAG: glucose-6-phosphate isomerase [Thermodesulfovibrionales bacterium]|nr:glucose-6-phosphate isomerase [Thermodesulfovibrionales bacterium]